MMTSYKGDDVMDVKQYRYIWDA